jgi:hypothetical protein
MRRALLVTTGVLVAILLVLGVTQLILPGIAEQRLRDRLAHSGKVISVQVNAFPAIELLWHRADRVTVRMASYRSSPGSLSSTVGQVADVGSLVATATALDTGLLTLRDATLRKRGSTVTATATITEADLRAALPALDAVTPVASGGGALTLRGTASVFGVTAAIDVTVRPMNGALVASPDVPFGGLATITLFSNSSLAVQGVSATPVPGGFVLVALAHIR